MMSRTVEWERIFHGSMRYTIRLVYKFLKQNGYWFFCYTRLEKYFLKLSREEGRDEWTWHTIERNIRRLAHEYRFFEKMPTKRGCYTPTERFFEAAERIKEVEESRGVRRW